MRLLARGGGLLRTRRRRLRTGCVTVLGARLLGFCRNSGLTLWKVRCRRCGWMGTWWAGRGRGSCSGHYNDHYNYKDEGLILYEFAHRARNCMYRRCYRREQCFGFNSYCQGSQANGKDEDQCANVQCRQRGLYKLWLNDGREAISDQGKPRRPTGQADFARDGL